jgi:hypothetical protein
VKRPTKSILGYIVGFAAMLLLVCKKTVKPTSSGISIVAWKITRRIERGSVLEKIHRLVSCTYVSFQKLIWVKVAMLAASVFKCFAFGFP